VSDGLGMEVAKIPDDTAAPDQIMITTYAVRVVLFSAVSVCVLYVFVCQHDIS